MVATVKTKGWIKIMKKSLDGVIYDTTLAREILEQLPLTVIMVGYGGREYYDECYTNRKSYVRFISV
jgi:hypothetical protein